MSPVQCNLKEHPLPSSVVSQSLSSLFLEKSAFKMNLYHVFMISFDSKVFIKNRISKSLVHHFSLLKIKCKEVQITASQYNIFCNFPASGKAPE